MKITFQDLKIQMRGSELSFLRYAGLSDKQLSGKHQPCECCGGKDCYRTDKKAGNGSFFCGQAGGGVTGGDWIDHLCHVKSMSPSEVYSMACDYLGLSEMDADKKAEMETRLAREKKKAELKAALKADNEKFDFSMTLDIDELGYQISQRTTEKMVRLDEILAAHELIKSLTNRYYSSMKESSSYARSERLYRQLKNTSPIISDEAMEEAKQLKSLNNLYFSPDDFGIMVVRELLIERKEAAFIAQVIKALEQLPERREPVKLFRNKEDANKFADFIKPAFFAAIKEAAA